MLLGAGASRDAGVPLATEMTEQIVKSINEESPGYHPMFAWDQSAWAINFVYAAIAAHDAASGANPLDGLEVERVFAAVRLLAERADLEVTPFVASWHPAVAVVDRPQLPHRFGDDLQKAIFDTSFGGREAERLVKQAIESQVGTGSGAAYRRLMDRMILSLRRLVHIGDPACVEYLFPIIDLSDTQGLLTVATLNYDRSLEIACERAGATFSTGIAEWTATGAFDWPEGGLQLLKLHGSIDWAVTSEHGTPGQLARQVIEVTTTPDTDQRPPAVIFGQREKLRAEGPFLELLSQFRLQLEQADELVIVGYSFRDLHINEGIRRWINGSDTRRIVVLDPSFGQRQINWNRPTFVDELRMALISPLPPAANTFPSRLKLQAEGAATGLSKVLADTWWDSQPG